ncbi:MAG: type I-E CRISPR-associated protein Cse2/CasB [Luteolibacter sp.]|jgi:CRISPR system Cascade subunit CasB|nr:type I-E CRISPR-associated protein Cse2/CasB [Luteolibacter sp.]
MSTTDYQKQNEDFVAALIKVCADRGLRAAMRRWWSEGTRHYAYPILGKLYALNDDGKSLIAALYAVHAKDSSPAHLPGAHSIGSAALNLGGGSTSATGFDSMERHFRRLLSAETLDDLGPQLHRLVKRLERESIPLDYARLLGDLRQFRNNPEAVKTRWALSFWQAPAEQPSPSEA